jgi:hypothetical protein
LAPAYTNTGKSALLNIDLQGRAKTVLEDSEMTNRLGDTLARRQTPCILEGPRNFECLAAGRLQATVVVVLAGP